MRIESDKKMHFLVSLGITLMLYPLIGWWSIGTALATGFGKELYDWRDYGLFSWEDIIADVAGTAIGSICLTIIKLVIS